MSIKINFDDLDLEVTIEGQTVNLKKRYQKELKLSEVTINEDLKNQPSLFAFYAVLVEMADAEYADRKLNLEIVEASLTEHYRVTLLKAGEKATIVQVQSEVSQDEERLRAVVELAEAKKNYGVLRAIKDAFNHRKESVIALASNMRAQKDVEIYFKKDQYRKDLKE